MLKATAILVTYNSADVIAKALNALQQPDIAQIIVVDNCSVDNTCDVLQRNFPKVRLFKNANNEGFGRANNRALQEVTTPYALLVNPDAVLKKGALAALLAAAGRYTDAAILAPILYDERGEPDHSYKQNVFAREKHRGTFVIPEGDLCADFLSGAVWLLNMELIKRMGFFDEHIFLYYEDDDLCLRTRQAGYGLVLVHDAAAFHLKGTSSGVPSAEAEFEKQKHMVWSRLYMEQKYHGEKAARMLAAQLNMAYSLKAAWYSLQFNKRKANRYRGRLAGIFAFTESTTQRQAA